MLLIVLGLVVWLGLFVCAVVCCGQAGIERSQSQAGVHPRKTTGKL
jgi:hypothetical protein